MNAPTKTFEVTIFLCVFFNFFLTSDVTRHKLVSCGLPPKRFVGPTVAAVIVTAAVFVTLLKMPPKAKSLVELSIDGVQRFFPKPWLAGRLSGGGRARGQLHGHRHPASGP